MITKQHFGLNYTTKLKQKSYIEKGDPTLH